MSDFKVKMHLIRFPLPRPLAVFKGPTSKGREGEREREGKEEGKGRGGYRREGTGGLAPNWGVWIRQCCKP